MKITILTIILFLYNISSISQNLTIDELVSMRKKSFGNVEEILSKKNWSYLEGFESKSDTIMNNALFAFNKDLFSDKAESFLKFIYNNSEKEVLCNHRINLEFFSKAKYNGYVNRLKELGCKLIKTKVEDGNIVKIYQGKTTTFQITIGVDNESGYSKTYYQFLIISNYDYVINFDEDSIFNKLKGVYFEEPVEE